MECCCRFSLILLRKAITRNLGRSAPRERLKAKEDWRDYPLACPSDLPFSALLCLGLEKGSLPLAAASEHQRKSLVFFFACSRPWRCRSGTACLAVTTALVLPSTPVAMFVNPLATEKDAPLQTDKNCKGKIAHLFSMLALSGSPLKLQLPSPLKGTFLLWWLFVPPLPMACFSFLLLFPPSLSPFRFH